MTNDTYSECWLSLLNLGAAWRNRRRVLSSSWLRLICPTAKLVNQPNAKIQRIARHRVNSDVLPKDLLQSCTLTFQVNIHRARCLTVTSIAESQAGYLNRQILSLPCFFQDFPSKPARLPRCLFFCCCFGLVTSAAMLDVHVTPVLRALFFPICRVAPRVGLSSPCAGAGKARTFVPEGCRFLRFCMFPA